MAEPDFEATWYPRIGKKAAEELRRWRKITIFGFTAPLFAIAAGLLIGTGTLNDVIGVALAAVGSWILGDVHKCPEENCGSDVRLVRSKDQRTTEDESQAV